MGGEFTVFDGIDVVYHDYGFVEGRPINGAGVLVRFLKEDWTKTEIFRPCASLAEAKEAAQALAERLKPLRPRQFAGFFRNPRLNAGQAALVACRNAAEAAIREWAGPEAVTVF
jgi:hypothetical protein